MTAGGSLRSTATPVLLLLPTLATLVALTCYPIVYSLLTSLQNFHIYRPHDRRFVGLENYIYLLTADSQFWHSLKLTATYTVFTVGVELTVGTTLAILAFRFFGRFGLARLLFALPLLMAPVVVALSWRFLLGEETGLANQFLASVGLPTSNWLHRPDTALAAVVAVSAWQWTPFVFLVLLAGMAGIPPSVWEAAQLDGANYLRFALHILLPMIRPLILFVVLIRTIDAFRTFDHIYVLTNGGPGTATYVLSYYASIVGFHNYNLGLAAAFSLVILFIITGLVSLLIRTLGQELF